MGTSGKYHGNTGNTEISVRKEEVDFNSSMILEWSQRIGLELAHISCIASESIEIIEEPILKGWLCCTLLDHPTKVWANLVNLEVLGG